MPYGTRPVYTYRNVGVASLASLRYTLVTDTQQFYMRKYHVLHDKAYPTGYVFETSTGTRTVPVQYVVRNGRGVLCCEIVYSTSTGGVRVRYRYRRMYALVY